MKRWLRDERGATSIEYALIATLIAVVIIGGVRSFANENTEMYSRVTNAIVMAIGGGGAPPAP